MLDRVSKESLNITKERKEKLKEIFPEVFTEDMIENKDGEREVKETIDFDKLKSVLGEEIATGSEQYRFSWAGKKDAIKAIQKESNGTLIPDKEESVDFDNSDNLFIEGDNLEVLKLLQKSYHSKVKMIYIDPPYNRGNDFVYKDDYKDNITNYLKKTGQLDENGDKLTTNTESNGRFHSDWLNMMYPRLLLARNLLKEDGVIFISIDDNEVHNLRKICDEIFGENNFIGNFPRVTKKAGKSSEHIAKNHDFVLGYSKSDKSSLNPFEHTDDGFKHSDKYKEKRGKYKLNQTLDYGSIQYSPSLDYEIELNGKVYRPGGVFKEEMQKRKKRNPDRDYCWRWSKDLFEFGLKNDFIVVKDSTDRIYTKTYQNVKIEKDDNEEYYVKEEGRTKPVNTLYFTENKFSNDNSKKDLLKLFEKNIFEYTKSVDLIKTLVFLGTKEDDIILDFFAGSATTAQAVLEQNKEDSGSRKFLMVQLPEPTKENSPAFQEGFENIADIGKERIRRVINGYGDHDPIDDGFKVFKLNKSNYKIWEEIDSSEATVEDIKNQMKIFEDSLVKDYRDVDVLYEVIIKEGYSLNAQIKEQDLKQNTVYKIIENGDYFYVCLDKKVEFEILDELDYIENETLFVCLDTALDDNNKINLSLKLNLKTV